MRKNHLSILILSSVTLAAAYASCDAPCFSSCECCEGPNTAMVALRHIEPGGIGYGQGYTSLDFFWAPNLCGNWTGFIDARGHIFNDGKWASNLGIGLRFLPECSDVIVGGNLYWDWREARHTTFNQLGAGLELLFPCWDVRVDGYIPVGHDKKRYRNRFDRFKGHHALAFRKWELSLWGVDAALGRWLYRGNCFSLHAAIAGYYFGGDFDKHAAGGLFRAKVQFWDRVDLRGQVSYDHLFKWQGQGELAVNFRFGCPVNRYPRQTRCCTDILLLEERLVEQPERFEIIVTTTKKKTAPAINPITGNLLEFWFVNNTGSGGNGTIENPFPTLVQAQNASSPTDVIYIFPGNGTDSGMNAGITLKDFQILTSSFIPFPIQTKFGNFIIPASSTQRPTISNIGDVVTLANGNTISGLNINGTTSGLIALQPISNLTFFSDIITVTNTAIVNPDVRVVSILDTFNGQFSSYNNTISATSTNGETFGIEFLSDFTGTFSSSNDTISATSQNAMSRGISTFTTVNGTFSVMNDTISLNASGFAQGIRLPTFNGDFISSNNSITTISQNVLSEAISVRGNFTGTFSSSTDRLLPTSSSPSDYAAGIAFFSGLFNGTFSATSDTITPNSPSDAIGIFAPNSTGIFNARSNSITGAFNDNALFLEGNNMQMTIENNTLNSTNLRALEIINDSGTSHLKLVGNTISSPSVSDDGDLTNSAGTFEVESPNGAITGVEAINNHARLTTTGVITYVPLTP